MAASDAGPLSVVRDLILFALSEYALRIRPWDT